MSNQVFNLMEQLTYSPSIRFYLVKLKRHDEDYFTFQVYNEKTMSFLRTRHTHLTITIIREVTDEIVSVNDKHRIAEEFSEAWNRIVT